jgi:DNA polymerase epsilon subunit 1
LIFCFLESSGLRYEITKFTDLPEEQRANRIKARVKSYSHKVYNKITTEEIEVRKAVVCQRENPFYVDTVRAFRDRRYEYKALGKKAKRQLDESKTELDKVKASDLLLLYDSLQLAHKCILNSFYGYVMRKGARWHSIEMAGVVTSTGADIIRDARVIVEEIGRPLELDTDGIWCIIPATFPEEFDFKKKDG